MSRSVELLAERQFPAKEAVDPGVLQEILAKHNHARGSLISVLDEIQRVYGYLPESALRMVAGSMNQSLADIYGVATFYRSFSLQPRGENVISVCLGTACHVRHAPRIAEEFERRLGIRAGETTCDGKFTLETVNCLGACALGPIVVVNGRYFSNVGLAKVKEILADAREGACKSGAATAVSLSSEEC